MEGIIEIFTADHLSITWWQMVIRGIITFYLTILMIKVGGKRIFGKHTAFDIVLGIILGSIISRGITGNSPYFSTVITCFVLALLHRIVAFITFRVDKAGKFAKGEATLLVKDEKLIEENMARCQITENDILEAARQNGVTNIRQIKEAYLERSGEISIIK